MACSSSSGSSSSLPDITDKLNQLDRFNFPPKCPFGKTKVVHCAFLKPLGSKGSSGYTIAQLMI